MNVISGPLIVADIESKCYGKYCLTGIIRHWFHLLNQVSVYINYHIRFYEHKMYLHVEYILISTTTLSSSYNFLSFNRNNFRIFIHFMRI